MLTQQHTYATREAAPAGASPFAQLRARRQQDGLGAAGAGEAMDRQKPRTFPVKPALAAGISVLLLGTAAALYLRNERPRAVTVDAARLQVDVVRRAPFAEFIPVVASVVPSRTLYLDAVEGGQVTRVLVEEGQHVDAGQPLLELKNADLQLRLVEAEARLTEQVNNVNLRRLQVEQAHLQFQERLIDIAEEINVLERDLARHESLHATGVVSAKAVEDLRGAVQKQRGIEATVLEAQRVNRALQTSQTAQMQASVDAISGNLAVARDNLQSLLMRAPIEGQLTAFEAEVGEAKSRGQRIGQIDGVGEFRLSALIDEFYLDRVQVGQAGSMRVGAASLPVAVAKVYPNVRDRQFRIELAFAGTHPPDLRRGQTLQGALALGAQAESLVVSAGPWLADSGGHWALVLASDDRTAQRRAIRVSRRNPDLVEIEDGLSPGERLVVSSYAQYRNFDRIDIRGELASARQPPQENTP